MTLEDAHAHPYEHAGDGGVRRGFSFGMAASPSIATRKKMRASGGACPAGGGGCAKKDDVPISCAQLRRDCIYHLMREFCHMYAAWVSPSVGFSDGQNPCGQRGAESRRMHGDSMGIPWGFHGVAMGIPWSPGTGLPRLIPMHPHATPCDPMESPCDPMESPCDPMHPHATPCIPMRPHASPCDPMHPHASPCIPMGMHEWDASPRDFG